MTNPTGHAPPERHCATASHHRAPGGVRRRIVRVAACVAIVLLFGGKRGKRQGCLTTEPPSLNSLRQPSFAKGFKGHGLRKSRATKAKEHRAHRVQLGRAEGDAGAEDRGEPEGGRGWVAPPYNKRAHRDAPLQFAGETPIRQAQGRLCAPRACHAPLRWESEIPWDTHLNSPCLRLTASTVASSAALLARVRSHPAVPRCVT